MASESEGLTEARDEPSDSASPPFGPNTAQVHAFIAAVARLKPSQWKQVLASRRLVASVTKESSDDAGESLSSIRAALHGEDAHLSPELLRAADALFAALGKQSNERLVTAWQAASALVIRHHMPALKFAAHYAPFASVAPLAGVDQLDAPAKRFLKALDKLTAQQCEVLSRPWRLEHEASRTLLQAVARSRPLTTEEEVAVTALRRIPARLTGDAGWAAARTAVHGGRVLNCRTELPSAVLAELWAPIEPAIPLASLEEPASQARRSRPHATEATIDTATVAPVVRRAQPLPTGIFGPNSAEVATFVKGIRELTPIQWLRILDRRQLVALVTREGSAEPVGVVRSILAAIQGTRDMDVAARARAFASAEHAVHALEHRARLTPDQVGASYGPFAQLIPFEQADVAGFGDRLATLARADWEQVVALAPHVNSDAVAPLVKTGDELTDFLAGRTDDEAVVAWHAGSALVRRHQLTAIQFAASYAPFASAIPVNNPKTLGAQVNRYVTAVGRLSANQAELLGKPWRLEDSVSNALARATADGTARPAEEAAALAAVVTVPMRVSGSTGWAAVKTAAFGGRVIASRTRFTPSEMEALWNPIEPAIALSSVLPSTRSRR